MDYTKYISVQKEPGSEVLLRGSLPYSIIEPYTTRALSEITKTFQLPGFREGRVPERIVREHFSDVTILHEAVELFFKEQYEEVVKQLNVFPIDRPRITLTKVAPQNPIEFELRIAVVPEITLPDYKSIISTLAIEKGSEEISEAEVHTTIKELAKMSGGKDFNEDTFDPGTLTPEFINRFGKFDSPEQFKEHVKSSIQKDKERQNKERIRLTILDQLADRFTVDLPKVLVDSELNRMMRELYQDMEKHHISPKDYFEQIKKTESQVREEWIVQATKRVKIDILLTEIAKKESIIPAEDAIETQINHILHHDASLEKDRVAEYVTHMMTNESVLEFLEGLAQK